MPPFGASIRKPSALPLPTSSNGHVEEKSRVRAIRFRGGWSNAAVCGMVVITSLVWLGLLHIDRVRDGAIFCRSDKDGSGHGLSYFAIGQEDGAHSRLTNFHDDGKRMESVRPKVLAFVGINTGFDSGPRRKVLRETWFPSTPEKLASLEKSTGLVFRFVIGHTADPRKMKALKEEIEEHKDFMCIDAEETYNKLNLKTLAYFRTAYALFDADFYMKIDDDIYLRPDRLATLLSKPRETPRTYLGCMKKGPVVTSPNYKWYEPKSYMIGSEYFLHAYGPIYGLSKEVVANFAVTKNQMYRMFMNEDVTVGAWMLAMDVVHEDNRDICATACGPSSIAVWDLPKCSGLCDPTKRMLELHMDVSCSKDPSPVE